MERKNINFEILRILLMYFIVLFHFIVHGVSNSSSLPLSLNKDSWILFMNHYIILILMPIVSIAVNCYILISGYFLSTKPFKLTRISKIWVQCFFYSTIICISIYYFYPDHIKLKNIIGSFTPIKSDTYWFVTKYICLIVLSPFLIKTTTIISQKKFKQLLLILFFINVTIFLKIPYGNIYSSGTSLSWFIFLFLIGGYVKKYGMFENYNAKKAFIIITFLSIIFYLIKSSFIIYYTKHTFNYADYSYNGITFFVSLFFFLWIKKITFKENHFYQSIIKIAPYTFGVYLIHDNIYFRSILWKKLTDPTLYFDSLLFTPYMIMVCLIIFLICISIDYVREQLFLITKINFITNMALNKIILFLKKKL